MSGVRVGSDPEFFLINKEGTPVPAMFLLDQHFGQAYQPFFDGFQGEITTDSADNLKDAVGNIFRAVKAIHDMALTRNVDAVAKPAIAVSEEVLMTCPESVFLFGCDPSKNAFSGKVRNSQVIQELHSKHRNVFMAGGHIHLGMPEGASVKKPPESLIPYAAIFRFQAADVIRMFESIGVSLLNLVEATDKEVDVYRKRRLFYGLSGEYRAKNYGLEFRSPSCAWLMNPELSEMIFAAAITAFYSVFTGTHAAVFEKISVDDHIRAINDTNLDLCWKIHKTSMEIIQSSFDNKSDMNVASECSYTGIWDSIKEVASKTMKNFDFFGHHQIIGTGWGLA